MSEVAATAPRDTGQSSIDAVVEVYKRGVDRTLLRENMQLTPDERVRKMIAVARFAAAVRDAGRKAFGD